MDMRYSLTCFFFVFVQTVGSAAYQNPLGCLKVIFYEVSVTRERLEHVEKILQRGVVNLCYLGWLELVSTGEWMKLQTLNLSPVPAPSS